MRVASLWLLAATLCLVTAGCGPATGVTQGGPQTEEEKAAALEQAKQVEDEERAHFRKQ